MDIKQENKKLRELLWLKHGCQDLYGDDGEMQCSKCMIDFKRDSIEDINRQLTNNAHSDFILMLKQFRDKEAQTATTII